MESNQILKKSILGGFQKEGVLNYIEQLQLEICRLKNDIAEKNGEIEALERKESEYDRLVSENEALSAENERLKTELKAAEIEKSGILADWQEVEGERVALSLQLEKVAEEKAAADEAHAAEIGQMKAEYESKLSLYSEKLATIEAMLSNLEEAYGRIEESEKIVAAAQVKADAIVEQAEKTAADAQSKADELAEEAEKVVTAAQSKADELAEESEKAVSEALAVVMQANERIKTACINYDSSSVMLKASVENLLSVLEGLTGGKE